MAGYTDRPSFPGNPHRGASRQSPRARAPGGLRDRLAELNAGPARTAPPNAARSARRRDDETIRSLGEWIDEINRQPAVYDTGIKITTPEVWPPAPDGSPREGIAPWKLARRRELASRYGPLIAVAALAVLYFGYDAVIKRNGAIVHEAGPAAVTPARTLPLVEERPPHAGAVPARAPFRIAVAPLTAGRPSAVNVTATGAAVSGDAVFAFSGLPSGASLSAGSFADGRWTFTPRELPGLTLTPHAAYQGELVFKAALMRDGTELHSESLSLPVRTASMEPRQPAMAVAATASP
ncbi:MAG: hypothetical protein AB7G34_01380, partial [Hyphomicrobiales bacterium]